MLLLSLMHPIYIWTSDPGTVTHQYTAHWWFLLLGPANVYCCHCHTLVTLCIVCLKIVSSPSLFLTNDSDLFFESCFHRKLVVFVWVFLHNPGTGWCSKQAAGRSTYYQDKILFVFVNIFWQKSLIFSIMTSGFGLMFNICSKNNENETGNWRQTMQYCSELVTSWYYSLLLETGEGDPGDDMLAGAWLI